MFTIITRASVIPSDHSLNSIFQGFREETDPSDSVLDSGPGGRSQLLTDRDPILGGMLGLCDTAGKIHTVREFQTL